MTVVSRKRFLDLCEVARRRCAGSRSRAWLDADHVKEHVPKDAEIEFVGTVSGASEGMSLTRWKVPLANGRTTHALLLVPSSTIGAIVSNNTMVLGRTFDGRRIFY